MDQLKMEIIKCLRRTNRMHRSIIEHKLKVTGVYRAQHQLLMILSRNTAISQTEIAKRLECSTATVAVSLKKLEQRGYIIRDVRKDDNRFNQVVITELGNQVVSQSMDIFSEVDDIVFEGISKEEKEQLYRTLSKMMCNLEQYSEKEIGGKE